MSDFKRRFSDMDQKSSSPSDNPPYSRLFVVCSKSVTEDTLRNEFSRFGNIEELWVVKDRQNGESKGVVYIKFSKTSEAAKALEEMNGKSIQGGSRPIKVLVAHSRGEGSKKEPLEQERLLRLFVVCKKSVSVEDLEDHFKQFGEIDNIKIVKDRDTNESKGFAYVKYCRMSDAAVAYEQCDRSFKPKFAEPKPQPPRFSHNNGFESFDRYDMGFGPGPSSGYNDNMNSGMKSANSPRNSVNSYVNNAPISGEPYTKLQVLVSPMVTQEQLWRIFDIVPGMEFCRIFPDFRAKAERLLASVTYSSPQQASYAREKIHGFEYPPGQRMIVRPDYSENTQKLQQIPPPMSFPGASFPNINPGSSNNLTKNDIERLAENIKQATALLKAHTGMAGLSPATYDPHYCTASLPPAKSFDDEPADGTEARLFVVFNPSIPERYAIKDVFGRFGKITDIFLLASKNVGYISYTKKEYAQNAIEALHASELCGMYMKVMEAEPRRGHGGGGGNSGGGGGGGIDDNRRKRLKMQDDE